MGGKAAGVWRLADGTVALEPAARLPAATLDALDAEERDVVRFLGPPDRPPALSLSTGARPRRRR